MKKIPLLTVCLFSFILIHAQTNNTETLNLKNVPADHFMFQYGVDNWTNKPDSVKIGGGFSHHVNVYLMFNKFNKSNPKFAFAYGFGIGASHIFFDKTIVNIKSPTALLPFSPVKSTDNYYDQYKLTTLYFQVPLEYRYYSNPYNTNHSWKAAIGLKGGLLLNAYTWAKNYQNSAGQSIYGTSYSVSESFTKFINGFSLETTARFGYGSTSLHVGYNLSDVLQSGSGASMGKISIGLSISGL